MVFYDDLGEIEESNNCTGNSVIWIKLEILCNLIGFDWFFKQF